MHIGGATTALQADPVDSSLALHLAHFAETLCFIGARAATSFLMWPDDLSKALAAVIMAFAALDDFGLPSDAAHSSKGGKLQAIRAGTSGHEALQAAPPAMLLLLLGQLCQAVPLWWPSL